MSGFLCSMVGATFSVPAANRTAKTITVNGSAQIDTAQSKFGGSSFLSTYTGQNYISVANASDLLTGTGALTIEGWFRPDLAGDAGQGVGTRFWYFKGVNSATGTGVGVSTDGIRWRGPSTTDLVYTGTVSSSAWSHIAFVWNGSTKKIYLNGTEVASASASLNITDTSAITIGPYFTDNRFNYSGWIDEIRVSNIARYTSNFTAPTSAFVNDTNTLLLIHADGTDASTTFTDDVGVRAPIGVAAINQTQISTSQSQFGGASAVFDGNDDYLTLTGLPSTANSDFTWECWARFDILPWNQTLGGGSYMMLSTGGSGDYFLIARNGAGSQVQLSIATGGNKYGSWTKSGVNLSINTWYHIAYVRSSGVWKTFFNGTELTTFINDSNFTNSGRTENMSFGTIGRFIDSRGSMDGFIDEIRISNSARYSADFTPSTSAFTNNANTLMLLHCNGTNASTTFTDDNS